ncbi:MAG: hypothetical protein QM758_10400 [Armatimonas sp.]
MNQKLLLLAIGGVSIVGTASAQVPFRIARPVNGATVRETVKIEIPRSSLGQIKYLALTVDGKFRAGVAVPDLSLTGKPTKTDTVIGDAKTVTLLWNTKAPVADPKNPQILEGVEDGSHSIKVIGYGANDQKLAEETLTLTISNRGQLAMPAQGINLTYNFAIGEQTRWRQKTELEFKGERKAPPSNPLNGPGNGYSSPGGGLAGGFGGGDPEGGMMGGPRGGGMMGSGGGMMGMGGMQGRGGGRPGGMMGMGGSGPMGGGLSGSGGMGGMQGRGGGRPGGMMGMGGGGMMGGPMGGGMMGGGGLGGMMGGMGGFAGGLPDGPFTIPVQIVRAYYERTVEDQLEPGVYFVRDRVKEGTIVGANAAPMRLQDIYDFKSRYRSVRSRGQVKESIVPSSDKPGAYVALPIIDLGGQRRRIGSTWYTQAPVLLEWATMDTPPLVTATNTLETLEWQDGYKTARIKQTYNGDGTVPLYGGLGKMTKAKIKMVRTIWFAYNLGRVVRTETVTDVEGDGPADILSAMVPGAGIGGGGMMGGMGGLGGLAGGDPEGGMMGGGGMMGASGMGGMQGRGGGRPGGMMGMGGPMGGGMMGGGGMGMGGMQTQGETAKAPAHFVSTTTIVYEAPAAAKKAAPAKKK